MNQCWPDSLTHICSTRGRWVNQIWLQCCRAFEYGSSKTFIHIETCVRLALKFNLHWRKAWAYTCLWLQITIVIYQTRKNKLNSDCSSVNMKSQDIINVWINFEVTLILMMTVKYLCFENIPNWYIGDECICISVLGQHWFRHCLVICLIPRYYLWTINLYIYTAYRPSCAKWITCKNKVMAAVKMHGNKGIYICKS